MSSGMSTVPYIFLGFDVEVRNVEILCEMPDAESVPWTFGISTSACLEPLALKQILDPAQCWHAALILKEPQRTLRRAKV